METDYIEDCIAALPEHKRSAARAAFRDLLHEGGDENLLARLLRVFEATSAFAETIPAAITDTMRDGVAALEAQAHAMVEANAANGHEQHTQLSAFVSQLRASPDDQPALARIASGLEAHGTAINRVAASVNRLRHARVGMLLVFVTVAFFGGAVLCAGLFYRKHQDAVASQQYLQAIQARGVALSVSNRGRDFAVRLEGPPIRKGTDWLKDGANQVVGVEIVFADQ